MFDNYSEKLIEIIYFLIPLAILFGSIILFENYKKKDSKKNEDEK